MICTAFLADSSSIDLRLWCALARELVINAKHVHRELYLRAEQRQGQL